MALIKRSVKGSNLTPSEVDANFELVEETDVSTSNTITFVKSKNRRGSFTTPITGAIVIDDTNANDNDPCGVVIWNTATVAQPSISGATINRTVGTITAAGTYEIYFHRIDGKYNINIFGAGSGTASNTAPSTLTITEAIVTGAVNTAPDTLTITEAVVTA